LGGQQNFAAVSKTSWHRLLNSIPDFSQVLQICKTTYRPNTFVRPASHVLEIQGAYFE
jgi:hypothetical protein